MKQLLQKWRVFLDDQSGQDMIEYALVVAVIGLGTIACLKGLASNIANFWNGFFAKAATIWPLS